MTPHILWPEGTSSGACAPTCPTPMPHLLCTIKRAMAAHPCSVCGRRIGHDEPFLIDEPVDHLTHIDCSENIAKAADP
jgi:hypothetical protein